MKIDNAIDKLNAAYRRLDEPQGRIARRNARKAFMDALRALRKGLDDEYSLEKKPVRQRRKRRVGLKRVEGLVEVNGITRLKLLAHRVAPSYFKTIQVPPNGGKRYYTQPWVRRALDAGFSHETIAKAVRSQKVRRQIAASIRLGKKKAP